MTEEAPRKQRLLIYSDSPTWPSGLGRITRALLAHFRDRYELAVLGWAYTGLSHKFPCHIYHSTKHGQTDRDNTVKVCEDFKPDIILTVGDPWDFPHLPAVVDTMRRGSCPELRWYWVSLIDGHPLLDEWAGLMTRPDHLLVTSEYGRDALKALNEGLDPTIVRLGVDSNFWSIDEPQSMLMNVNGPSGQREITRENTFMILWIGVNHNRKNLSALIQGVTPLLEAHEDAYLWIQVTYDTPNGYDLLKIQKYENTPVDRMAIGLGATGQANVGIQDDQIKKLYGVASVVACPSFGEGNWMPGYEAQACGAIPVGTEFSAIPETIGTDGRRGVLVPPAYEGYGEHTMLRGYIDIEKFSASLEGLYQDWKSGSKQIKEMQKVGRRWAEFHTWERFCKRVEDSFSHVRVQPLAVKRDWVIDKVDLETEKTGMLCPTFQKNCGIGQYSVGLIYGMRDIGLRPDQYATYEPEMAATLARDKGAALLHIQHEFSFYKQPNIENAYKILRESGIGSVTTLHSVVEDRDQMASVMVGSDVCLVHSETQKELALKAVPNADVRIVPMGAVQVRLMNRDRLKANHGFAPDDFVIGSFGFMRPQKGYDTLINALSYLPDHVKLMIYASPHEFGSDAWDEDFMRMVEQFGPERITLIREQLPSKQDVINVLQMCDVLSLACRDFDGIGISSAVMDCASAGRPLILSDSSTFSAVPEKMEVLDKELLLRLTFPQEDFEALADRVNILLEYPEQVKEMSAASQAFAWSRDWTKVAKLHAEIYESIIGRRL